MVKKLFEGKELHLLGDEADLGLIRAKEESSLTKWFL